MIDSQLYRWWMFMVSLNVGTLLNANDFRRRSGQSFLMFLGNDLVEAPGLAPGRFQHHFGIITQDFGG